MNETENILIFDTETIGLEKTFCYDLGYVIADTKGNILKEQSFIIEQIWSNKPLFETAYYSTKKQLYIGKLRSRQSQLIKWGFACAKLINDIKQYNVKYAYAYNSNFDIRVFDFTCDWFKTRNPLDYVQTFDIWGYTSALIQQGLAQDYVAFVAENGFITDSGNIQNNADTWGKFLLDDVEWVEEHTGLADAKIEKDILIECVKRSLEWHTEYKPNRQISGKEFIPYKTLTLVDKDKICHYFEYKSLTHYKSRDKIILKD